MLEAMRGHVVVVGKPISVIVILLLLLLLGASGGRGRAGNL